MGFIDFYLQIFLVLDSQLLTYPTWVHLCLELTSLQKINEEKSKLDKSSTSPFEVSGNKLQYCILPRNLEEKNSNTQKEILGLFPLKHWADKFNFDRLISSQKFVIPNQQKKEEKQKPKKITDQTSQNTPTANCQRIELQNRTNLIQLSAKNTQSYYEIENSKLPLDLRMRKTSIK